MVDRNKNGIDDSREGGLLSGMGGRKGPNRVIPHNQGGYAQGSTSYQRPTNPNARFSQSNSGIPEWLLNPVRQFDNFVGDMTNFSGIKGRPGQGAGDYVWGTSPDAEYNMLGRQARRGPSKQAQQQTPMGDTALPSFLSNLMEALGYVGNGSMDYVDYDPLRNDARSRGTEYDARLNAMYNQLQGSIRDDGTTLQGSYQGAIDDTAERAAQAQAQTQQAGDAAQARNTQQLQALGIGEAAGNIVEQGRDLNTDVAAAVQDAASRGQIAGDALQQNQQSAVQHNTNLVGAAGLEGNLQRARVQSELGSLLAQYDMQEQQANQEVDQFNASQANNGLSQAMSLAEALTGNQWQQRSYQDELDQMLYERQMQGAQPNKANQSLQFLQQLMQQQPDMDMESITQLLSALGSSSKLF